MKMNLDAMAKEWAERLARHYLGDDVDPRGEACVECVEIAKTYLRRYCAARLEDAADNIKWANKDAQWSYHKGYTESERMLRAMAQREKEAGGGD